MKKVLIIDAHPHPKDSVATTTILQEVKRLLPEVTIRPIGYIATGLTDVPAEQGALKDADIVVFQFPFYWFNVPSVLKTWMDDVLTHGFAYGTGGDALHGKTLMVSTTAGSPLEVYQKEGEAGHTIDEFLLPLRQSAAFCGMKYVDPVVSGGMLYIPGVSTAEDLAKEQAAAKDHAARLVNVIQAL